MIFVFLSSSIHINMINVREVSTRIKFELEYKLKSNFFIYEKETAQN